MRGEFFHERLAFPELVFAGLPGRGERAAEQAAMVVNSLFVIYEQGRKPKNDARIRTAIGDLYKQFENPSAYNPRSFARGLRELGTLAGGLS